MFVFILSDIGVRQAEAWLHRGRPSTVSSFLGPSLSRGFQGLQDDELIDGCISDGGNIETPDQTTRYNLDESVPFHVEWDALTHNWALLVSKVFHQ